MSAELHSQSTSPEKSQHAQDLLARLYREIGISAVAAALQVAAPKQEDEPEKRRDVPAILRKDLAA